MFSSAELAYMRDTQEAHMMDTCNIYRVASRTKNSRGESVKTFAQVAESICGLEMNPISMSSGDGYQVAEVDAVLRLPLDVTVTPGDEIEITKRFGETVNARRYEVERYENSGPSGNRAYLKVQVIP